MELLEPLEGSKVLSWAESYCPEPSIDVSDRRLHVSELDFLQSTRQIDYRCDRIRALRSPCYRHSITSSIARRGMYVPSLWDSEPIHVLETACLRPSSKSSGESRTSRTF